jgi:putative ABC transport system permease protein
VAAEVAIALILLCGAGVLLEGARAQARVDAGFDAKSLLHARLNLPRDKYVTFSSQRTVVDQIVASLAAIPGVRHAAAVDVPPGVGGSNARAVLLDTDPAPAGSRIYVKRTSGSRAEATSTHLGFRRERAACSRRPTTSQRPSLW